MTHSPIKPQNVGSYFEMGRRKITKEVELSGYVMPPKDQYRKEPLPLLVYLHGAGGGSHFTKDEEAQYSEIGRAPTPRCIKAFPDCPPDTAWSPDAVKAFIDSICDVYYVDVNKIYLTGYSMGGRGTWDTVMEYPNTFAAVMPLCGYSCYLKAPKMRNVPVWALHGEKDFVVPDVESRKMIETLKRIGSPDARLSIIPGEGHGINWVYEHPKLWEWLFSKSKR